MILYLTGKGLDLGCDLLFNGLVELFGQDNIIDFPYSTHRHREIVIGNYYDLLCSTIDKDSRNRIRYNIEEIIDLINRDFFDLCIVSTRALNVLRQFIYRNVRLPKLIIVNGEDDSDMTLYQMEPLLSKYWDLVSLFLQRDYRCNVQYDSKIVPYNFSCPVNILPHYNYKIDKDIDIFGQFAYTHPFRKKVINKIISINNIKSHVGRGGIPVLEYFSLMNNSKISISMNGAGWDTFRYLEIPFMKSMLLAQHPKDAFDIRNKSAPVIYLNNFMDRYSAVFYKTDLSDLEELVRYYIDNDKDRELIIKRGYQHVTNNLTTKCMANYILRCLDDNYYWRHIPLN